MDEPDTTQAQPQLVTASQVEPELLSGFLQGVYSPAKSSFLAAHGDWWHGGDENRWVLLVDGQIAGYCAVIPVKAWIHGKIHPAIWWVDLIISPDFRGRGLQTIFDEKIRQAAELKLGFPNELAAKIHRKHRWGVREDLETRLLPLRPLMVKSLRQQHGGRGALIRGAALGLTPIAMAWGQWLNSRPTTGAWQVDSPRADLLAGVFERFCQQYPATIYRDADYIQWRFLNAPYRNELGFYLAGPEDRPSHYAVTRQINFEGILTIRILDNFGDLTDREGQNSLFHLVLKEAVRNRASQVTALVSDPALGMQLTKFGFIARSMARFCWYTPQAEVMQALDGRAYWVLADSDNDAPD